MSTDTVPLEATVTTRLFGAISWILFSINGIVLNIILATVFFKNKRDLKANAFYTITLQLIFCDLLAHFLNFSVAIPITLAGYNVYEPSFRYLFEALCPFQTLAYMAGLYFSLLLTANRFLVFILPSVNRFVFQRFTALTIALMWVFVLTDVTTIQLIACYKTFNSVGFFFENVCGEDEQLTMAGFVMKRFSKMPANWFPLVMFATYVFLILYIKIKVNFRIRHGKIERRQASLYNHRVGNKRELSLLLQSFIVCGFFVVEKYTFNALPVIQAEGQWTFIVRFVGSWTTLLLNSIHPIVLFTFNSDIRRRLQSLVKSQISSRGSFEPSSRDP